MLNQNILCTETTAMLLRPGRPSASATVKLTSFLSRTGVPLSTVSTSWALVTVTRSPAFVTCWIAPSTLARGPSTGTAEAESAASNVLPATVALSPRLEKICIATDTGSAAATLAAAMIFVTSSTDSPATLAPWLGTGEIGVAIDLAPFLVPTVLTKIQINWDLNSSRALSLRHNRRPNHNELVQLVKPKQATQ